MPKVDESAPAHMLVPSMALRVCPFCGVPASWRYDKKQRPFHYCGDCGARVFIYTLRGLVGFELLCQTMVRSGVGRHRNLVHRIVGQRIAQQRVVAPGRRAASVR